MNYYANFSNFSTRDLNSYFNNSFNNSSDNYKYSSADYNSFGFSKIDSVYNQVVGMYSDENTFDTYSTIPSFNNPIDNPVPKKLINIPVSKNLINTPETKKLIRECSEVLKKWIRDVEYNQNINNRCSDRPNISSLKSLSVTV